MRLVVVHPARASAAPNADGFHQVHSRRRKLPVPEDLIGLCFNRLGDDHVKADCLFPSQGVAVALA